MATAIQKAALCFGQKFGHDFHKIDGICSKCGINQSELRGGLEKIEYFVKKPEKGMHSEAHALAKEISEFCGEPKRFGMYLGIIKNMGLQRAYQIFAELRQAKKIETPGKLFVYLSARNKSPSFKPKEKITNGSRTKSRSRQSRESGEPRRDYFVRDGNSNRTRKNTPKKTKRGKRSDA